MTPRTSTAAPAASPPPSSPPPSSASVSTAAQAIADAQRPGGLSDAALVDAAIGCQVAENAARAGRLAAILAFHAR